MSPETKCEPQTPSRLPSSHPPRGTRSATWPVPVSRYRKPSTWLRHRSLRPRVTCRPRPGCRCQPPPSWRRRRRRSAAISTAGEAPPAAICGQTPCLRHPPRPAEGHARDLALPTLRPRLCHLRPASAAVLKETAVAALVSPQVRSWAPPTSYHLRRAWAAAKPSLAADEATKEPVPAVRSTWAPP